MSLENGQMSRHMLGKSCNKTISRRSEMTTNEQNEILMENRTMRKALEKIAKWHGEFPQTFDRLGGECSYEGQHGSNGARDYMRGIATDAIPST